MPKMPKLSVMPGKDDRQGFRSRSVDPMLSRAQRMARPRTRLVERAVSHADGTVVMVMVTVMMTMMMETTPAQALARSQRSKSAVVIWLDVGSTVSALCSVLRLFRTWQLCPFAGAKKTGIRPRPMMGMGKDRETTSLGPELLSVRANSVVQKSRGHAACHAQSNLAT